MFLFFAGVITFTEGWQQTHGDLVFDPVQFPDYQDMLSGIIEKGYETSKQSTIIYYKL